MSRSFETTLQRAELYLARVKRDLEQGDRSQAICDCAEACELLRRLWSYLAESQGYSSVECQIKLSGGGWN
jgi:hypothetical protein